MDLQSSVPIAELNCLHQSGSKSVCEFQGLCHWSCIGQPRNLKHLSLTNNTETSALSLSLHRCKMTQLLSACQPQRLLDASVQSAASERSCPLRPLPKPHLKQAKASAYQPAVAASPCCADTHHDPAHICLCMCPCQATRCA